jgi:uncharacterized OB-fold protein
MSTYSKPLPDLTDPLTAPFWQATREGTLLVQKCGECGYLRWPPGPVCTECQTTGGVWTPVGPAGVLYSYAEYHRALAPAFKDEVPYAVGLIELDDGPRMYGALVGLARTEDIGQRVHAVFDPVTPEVTLVKWQLSGARS